METKVKIIERVEQKEEEVTKELKKFMMQETARGFALFQEALLVFEARPECRAVHENRSSRSECYCRL